MIRFDHKIGLKLFLTVIIVCLLFFSSIQFQTKASAQTTEQRTMVFEDGFEGSIANFWDENHGITNVSTTIAHSGNHSLVVNGVEGGLVHNFPGYISGEKWDFEAWFYDNMSTSVNTFAFAVGGSLEIGALMWSGGDFNKFYGYRNGDYGSEKVGSIPRSQGWHNATITCRPENLTIYIDDAKLYQTSGPFSFNRFFFGDWWRDVSVCNICFDDIKVWNYQSNNPSPTPTATSAPTQTPNPTVTEPQATISETEPLTATPMPTPTLTSLTTPKHTSTPTAPPNQESNAFLVNPETLLFVFAGIFVGTPILTFIAAKSLQKKNTKGLDNPKLNFNKLVAATLALILLSTMVTAGVVALNNTINTPKEPQPNIVDITLIIESNVDWTGSVTTKGLDYGFYSISGSMDDSINKDNATYTYQYTANTADVDIQASFNYNLFGQGITVYDGYLYAREYVNGTLEFEKTLTPFSSNEFDWWYQAGYA